VCRRAARDGSSQEDRDLEVFQAPGKIIVDYIYFREAARAMVPIPETEKFRRCVRQS
jgi:hypothetical protein